MSTRKEKILSWCDEFLGLGVPDYAVRPIFEYAETITYCSCGHERTQHGNGIVDRRCLAEGCDCAEFHPEEEA